MTDSVSSVSTIDSAQQLVERISSWAQDNPEASEYCLGDELEARELLVVIVANIKQSRLGCSDLSVDEIRQIRRIEREMRKAIAQAKAMDYVRELNKTDPLEFLGLRITTPAIVLQ